MNTFFLALTLLCAAGVVALFCNRFFLFMKACFITCTLIGCGVGIYAVASLSGRDQPVHFVANWMQVFTLSFSLDNLSAFFLIPIFAVCPLAVLYSFHYFRDDEENRRVGVNYFFTNLLVVAMALVVTADNIISLALAWECMSVTSFILVMFDYEKEATRRAGYIYFIFTQIGAMFLFAALALAYSYSGNYDLASLGGLPRNIKLAVFFLALVGFGSKAGIFPLHMWLPHAHPAAPSNISAIMSGVMIKMGIYGIVRFYLLIDVADLLIGQTILILGMVSGVLGVVYALGKHDLKKLLAYHSVENIGIILIGAGVGMIGLASDNAMMAGFGFAGCLLHVLNHSIFKSLLFLGAGAVLQATNIRHIDELGGLLKKMPFTGRTFLIGSISISGLPPFNGFISEFLIYYGAFQGMTLRGSSFIFAMLAILALAIIGGLAAACFAKVVGVVFLGEPRTRKAEKAGEAGSTMTIPMVLLAVSCLVIGVFPAPFVKLAFFGLQGSKGMVAVDSALLAGVSGNLAFAAQLLLGGSVVVAGLRKIFYAGKKIGRGPTWGCGFTQPTVRMQYTGTSFAMSIVDFFRPFVQVRTNYSGIDRIFPGKTTYDTKVDDVAETVLVDKSVSPLIGLLGKLRWIQHGQIQMYIGYIFLTIIVLLMLAY
jgi:hydrogenase-4 component B